MQEQKLCPHCDTQNSLIAQYCSSCGHKLHPGVHGKNDESEEIINEVLDLTKMVMTIAEKVLRMRKAKNFGQFGNVLDEAISEFKKCGPRWHKAFFYADKKFCPLCGVNLEEAIKPQEKKRKKQKSSPSE